MKNADTTLTNNKEMLEYIIKNSACTKMTCMGRINGGIQESLNVYLCPLSVSTNIRNIYTCGIHFNKDNIPQAAKDKLEEIKKLEYLENLK